MKTDNELIAVFMGGKLCDYPDGIFDAKGYYCHKGNWWNRNHLAYHESWDWLMPVVEKIEDSEFLKQPNGLCYRFKCVMAGNECEIISISRPSGAEILKFRSQDAIKMDAVFRVVVRFIKWTQTNQPPA